MIYEKHINLKCPYCHEVETYDTADFYEGVNPIKCTNIDCEKYYAIDINLFHKIFTYKLIPAKQPIKDNSDMPAWVRP